VRQLFVELSVAQLSQLTVSARARHDENDAVAQFAASLMPSSEFERVFPRGSAQEYCSLLELWISAADAEPTADLAGRCRIQLGVDQNVLIPVEVDGVLVLPGILLGGPGYSLTTVRRQGDSNENLTMSGISFDLIALMVATPTIELLSSRIEKLPLAEGSPTSYVEKRMRNERTALGMYTGHLSDREQLLNAVLTANDDVLILSESVTERRLTRFLNAGRMREFPEIVDEQYPNVRGSYDPLSHLTMHFKEALLSYEQAKRRAEGRDQLIAEYLRDRVNAEIAVSNLKIQRTVSALTMFAIALAGLALAEGLLTDTAKTQVLQWLMKLFIH
jgi:hypothetical protein